MGETYLVLENTCGYKTWRGLLAWVWDLTMNDPFERAPKKTSAMTLTSTDHPKRLPELDMTTMDDWERKLG